MQLMSALKHVTTFELSNFNISFFQNSTVLISNSLKVKTIEENLRICQPPWDMVFFFVIIIFNTIKFRFLLMNHVRHGIWKRVSLSSIFKGDHNIIRAWQSNWILWLNSTNILTKLWFRSWKLLTNFRIWKAKIHGDDLFKIHA